MKYESNIVVGYSKDGKQLRKRIRANSRGEFNRLVYEAKRKHEVIPDKITFGEYSKKWLEHKQVEAETRRGYERCLKHCTALEELPMAAIKRYDVQCVIHEVWDRPSLAKKVHVMLSQIFTLAIDDEICLRNPAHNVEVPKSRPVYRSFLSDAQKDALIRADLNETERAYVTILYSFGLRPGEALALMTKDFDFKKMEVTIDKAVAYQDNGHPYLKGTKTGSVRVLPIPNSEAEFLKKYCKGKIYLFPGKFDTLMSQSTRRRMWYRIRVKWNEAMGGNSSIDALEGVKPYIFRYTYATDLYYSGIDLKKAAYLMGHSNTNMLLKIYAQLDDDRTDLTMLRNRSLASNF